MAVILFVSQKVEFTKLLINSIQKDLQDSNELNVCLALQAIANIASKEMLESLGNIVLKLILS